MRLLALLILIGFAAPAQTRRIWDSVPICDSLIYKRIDSLMNKQVFSPEEFLTEKEATDAKLPNFLLKEYYLGQCTHTYSKKLKKAIGENVDEASFVGIAILPKHRLFLFKTMLFLATKKSRQSKLYTKKGKRNRLVVMIYENDPVTKDDFMKEAIKLKDALLLNL